MSYQSNNLDLEVLEEGDPADLTTVSDNFDKIDAVVGDIATVESSPTAAAHSVGEFLLYEGRLYKVTAAISAGGSLILGTNVSAASIGNELKNINGTALLATSRLKSLAVYESSGNEYSYTLPVANTSGVGRNHFGILFTWYGAWLIRTSVYRETIECYPMASSNEGVTLSASGDRNNITFTLSRQSWGGVRFMWLD